MGMPPTACTTKLQHTCVEMREDPLYVIRDGSNVHAYVCRCKHGYKRAAKSCVPCFNELCPRYSDVAVAQDACAAPAPREDRTPANLTHLLDPVAARPCRTPLTARFAPAVPFYFDASTHIVGAAPRPLQWCPPGQEYHASPSTGAWRQLAFADDTSELRERVRVPMLSRMPFAADTSLELPDQAYAFENGGTWVPDRARTCLPCPADSYCQDGLKYACPNASIAIGAGSASECLAPPVPDTRAPPCPSGAARRGPNGACVCLGDLVPRTDTTLRAGMVCTPEHDNGIEVLGPHIVRNGSVVRGPRAIAYWHAGDVVVDELRGSGPRTVWTRRSETWEIAGLGLTHVFLFSRDAVHVVREGLGLVESVSVSTPDAESQTRNVTVRTNATLYLPLRWYPIENFTATETEGPFVEILRSGVVQNDTSLRVTEASYTMYGITNISSVRDIRVQVNGTVYQPFVLDFDTDAKILPETVQLPPLEISETTETGWVLARYEVKFEADTGRGALVHEYYSTNDATRRAFGAVCFSDTARSTSTLVFAAENRSCSEHLLTWQVTEGTWACLNTTDCTWQTGTSRILHADLDAGDAVTRQGAHIYHLGRSTLPDAVSRQRMFGEGRGAVGWWEVRLVARPGACRAPHAVWKDGACHECPVDKNCSHHAWDVNCTEALGGCNECPCAPGLRARTDGSCQVCEKGKKFCKFGREHLCPPNSETVYSGSTECVCKAGFFGRPPRCTPCPRGYYCQDTLAGERLRVACEHGKSTAEAEAMSSADCKCRPGWFLLSDHCTRCPYGTYTENFNTDTACTPCTSRSDNQYCPCSVKEGKIYDIASNNCTEVCTQIQLNSGYFVHAVEHRCALCPPGWFCAGGVRTQCPHGMTSLPAARADSDCQCTGGNRVRVPGIPGCVCKKGTYDVGGACEACPEHSTSLFGARSIAACFCRAGFSRVVDGATMCELCKRGHFCPQNTSEPQPCPTGTFAPGPGLKSETQCLPCMHKDHGQSGMWHPLACSKVFRSFRIRPSALPFLNAHRPRLIADMDAAGVTDLPELHVDVQVLSLSRPRVQVEARPEYVDEALRELLQNDEHWTKLKQITRTDHALAYSVAAASFFCNAMRQEMHLEGDNIECHVPLAVQDAHRVLKTADFFEQGVQVAPDTRQFVYDLRLTLAAQEFQTMIVLPVGSDAFIAADFAFETALSTQRGYPTRYYAITEGASCADSGALFLQDCLRQTVHSNDRSTCAFCSPHEYYNETSGQCETCATLGECPFGGQPCCGTNPGQCLFVKEEAVGVRCLDGIHDENESCDPTALASPLAQCCNLECNIKQGFKKIGDTCGTICGDGEVADGVEDCDNYGDMECDMRTCKFIPDEKSEL